MIETIISVVALLLILEMGRLGSLFGFFLELTSTLLLFFAMMVGLRYWFVATQLLRLHATIPVPYAMLICFWTVFVACSVPLVLLTQRISEDKVPRYPRRFDALLGFVFGVASGTILVCIVLTSLSIVLPTMWTTYDQSRLLVPLDQVPLRAYRFVEQNCLRIPADDARHTPLPTLVATNAEDVAQVWR